MAFSYSNNFEELGHLGGGGFGQVFKVRDKIDNQFYAVKKIKDQDHDKIKEVIKEAQTLAKLGGDRVVRYMHCWVELDTVFIKMELCSDNLRNLIDSKPGYFDRQLSEPMGVLEYSISCQIFKELLKCVQYLHESKPPVIHRDLKPQNILISINQKNRKCLKICDFGLATFHDMTYIYHTNGIGSFAYLAPEVAKPRSKYNIKADIFSLGKIFEELFDIDINRSFPNYNPHLFEKMSNMTSLIISMTETIYARRPICSEILSNLEKYTLALGVLKIQFDLEDKIKQILANVPDDSIILEFMAPFLPKKKQIVGQELTSTISSIRTFPNKDLCDSGSNKAEDIRASHKLDRDLFTEPVCDKNYTVELMAPFMPKQEGIAQDTISTISSIPNFTNKSYNESGSNKAENISTIYNVDSGLFTEPWRHAEQEKKMNPGLKITEPIEELNIQLKDLNCGEKQVTMSNHIKKEDDDYERYLQSHHDQQIKIQKKTFTKWMNSYLEKVDMEVDDIFIDIRDGRKLLKLLEIISGEKIAEPTNGRMRIHNVENVDKSIHFLNTKFRLHLENIGAADIVDGNQRLILGLLFSIILRFQIHNIEIEVLGKDSGKKTSKAALFLWCQRKIAGYPFVKVMDFSKSWRSGMAFNALIDALRPDLIDYKVLSPNNHIKNLNNAFTVAQNHLGIPKLLDAEDLDIPEPDEISILTYVSLFYHYSRQSIGHN